ncbi:hypothetical protein HMPREF9332_00313 [Alloprevotella rava F0323]|uniref:DUF177 domain-containing protein n=2 Tax=Alloprevotella rava TaxID=671218 RepID=G5G9R2_9BACT|nr:hypothetical protein HMPREF9332_00313 [Alloprevotella rava F0323]
MASKDNMLIDIRKTVNGIEPLHFSLHDDFFAEIEQDEIKGGRLDVTVKVREAAGDIYTVKISLQGSINVLCDRCLDELSIDIDTSDVVRVSYGDEAETTDYDLKFVPHNSNMYNIAWDIYEIAVTSLPLERVHPEGKCDKDMLIRFSAEKSIDELDA